MSVKHQCLRVEAQQKQAYIKLKCILNFTKARARKTKECSQVTDCEPETKWTPASEKHTKKSILRTENIQLIKAETLQLLQPWAGKGMVSEAEIQQAYLLKFHNLRKNNNTHAITACKRENKISQITANWLWKTFHAGMTGLALNEIKCWQHNWVLEYADSCALMPVQELILESEPPVNHTGSFQDESMTERQTKTSLTVQGMNLRNSASHTLMWVDEQHQRCKCIWLSRLLSFLYLCPANSYSKHLQEATISYKSVTPCCHSHSTIIEQL